MMIIAIYWSVFALIHLGMATPPALRDRSWTRLFIALVLSFAGITLPIFVFLASTFLAPEWKGGCRHGWLDCFLFSKLALFPLVLWASASLYAIEIFRTPNRTHLFFVSGMVTGAMVSTVCFGLGLISLGNHDLRAWLLVPLYVSIWYLIRAWQLLKAAKTTLRTMVTSLLVSTPFWIAAVIGSRKFYASLPDKAPSCFIATAALRGHAVVVGARLRVRHRGEDRVANQQLLTLWRFEELWANRAPRSHARFRRFYNRIGPVVAARISSPFLADVAYVAIKPAEILARAILAKERG